MSTLGQNVRRIRESKEWSQDRLATEAGVSQTTIDKIERGLTKRTRHLNEISYALGVPPTALDPAMTIPSHAELRWTSLLPTSGAGPERIHVFAAAEGGSGNLIIDKGPIDDIARPEFLAQSLDAYALYIVGESMVPEFDPGDTALVDPGLPPIGNTPCIFFTDNASDDRASIKRLLRVTPTAWHVQQWNPVGTFDLTKREWPKCHRVVGKINRR